MKLPSMWRQWNMQADCLISGLPSHCQRSCLYFAAVCNFFFRWGLPRDYEHSVPKAVSIDCFCIDFWWEFDSWSMFYFAKQWPRIQRVILCVLLRVSMIVFVMRRVDRHSGMGFNVRSYLFLLLCPRSWHRSVNRVILFFSVISNKQRRNHLGSC